MDGQQLLACFILLEGGFGNSMDVRLVRHRRFPHPLLAARYRMSVPEGSGGIGKSGSKDGHCQVIEPDTIRGKVIEIWVRIFTNTYLFYLDSLNGEPRQEKLGCSLRLSRVITYDH